MLRLTVAAHPGARVERVELLGAMTLGVWVRARPIDGQANLAIERVVASALSLRPRQVRIVGGGSSRRHKIVEVDLPGQEALQQRLMASRARLMDEQPLHGDS
jgi:uncharacterized protein YggU (UPF0235/DUF167 family)